MSFTLEKREDQLGDIVVLTGTSVRSERFVFIPYYYWDNREPGFMQVWVKEEIAN